MYAYKKNNKKITKAIILVALVIISSALSIYIYDMYSKIEVHPYIENNNTNKVLSYNKDEENNIVNILENLTESVVGISKIKNSGETIFESNSTLELGLGTGIIVSENGYIVTNWHVAGNKYSNCYITLENGENYTGEVVWENSDLDLAIVKIKANGLKYVTLGNSDNIKLGEKTYAIGNPIGVEFQRTVTSGIISGLNRTIRLEEEEKESYLEDLIQTDATINPGNSGGPLINSNGEIIGINTVKINDADGIGFAIPINIIKPVIESFVQNNRFEEAYLGIFAYDKSVMPYLENGINFENGIYVAQISYDGPCQKAGLRVGDIITEIDGIEINKMSQLREYIYQKKVNDTIILTIIRNKRIQEINVELERKV